MRPALIASLLALAACNSGPQPPATMDARGGVCAYCRMAMSASGAVAQLVAPGDDPRFFDDIGCLASFLKEHADQPAGAIAFVVDHQTHGWIPAGTAVYARVPDLDTPMGSHLVAHADERQRRSDPMTARASVLSIADVFGARMPPGGRP